MTAAGKAFNLSNITPLSPLQFIDNLMTSFATQTEQIIQAEVDKFKGSGPNTHEIEICHEDGIYQYVEHYCGLTDEDVLLEDVFTEFFPSLNRRSAFQTIYSRYEVELQALCLRYQRTLAGKGFDKFDGTGIIKAHNFIKEHFPAIDKSSEWESIDQLRILRNRCIHHDGKVYRESGTPFESIARLIEAKPGLFHHDGQADTDEYGNAKTYSDGSARRKGQYILFESGSLGYSINAFKAYTKVIDQCFRQAS